MKTVKPELPKFPHWIAALLIAAGIALVWSIFIGC